MKRILILTADYGYGHRSAANAIATALKETYGPACRVDIVNPLDDPRAPAFLREDQSHYDRLVREMPELYKLGYEVSELRVAGRLLNTSWTLMLFNALRSIVRKKKPDVIICTYLFYQGILSAVFALEKQRIPLLTVVTDLATVNRLWFHPAADLCLTPTQTVYDLALEAGLPAEKLRITGIPVRPELGKELPDRAALRAGLGWDPELFTVLAVGSKRVERLYESVRALNHSGLPLQLAVVTGGDEAQFQRFQDTEWHRPAYVYNYVSEMGSFMRAADCILGKAGGLTVAEALACGRPLILIDIIPGQETGNAEHVIAGEAGVLACEPVEVLEAACHMLEKDRQMYQRMAHNAHRLGRPQAAYEVARLAWEA